MNNICIKERTANGTAIIPIESELLGERIIFLEGDITMELATSFLKQVMRLVSQDKEKPIKVIISSFGGSVDAGLIIYDILQTAETKIILYCAGVAYSMAALLFLSGKNGRYLLEHSKLMIHEPLIKNLQGGNATSINSISESLQKTKKQLNEIISKHSGQSLEEIEKSTSYDHYFSAKEAVEYGLADGIITTEDMWREVK